MESFNRKNHWENIYQTKAPDEVSWYQPKPEVSLGLIKKSGIPLNAKIIDIGGGDGLLVDFLLAIGFTDITVLDISEAALDKAKNRLGENAHRVKWIVADITTFNPKEKYDLWHDRAVFHFLVDPKDAFAYIKTAAGSIQPNGTLIIGTFAEDGPKKCSGIDIRQYSGTSLAKQFEGSFDMIECIDHDHKTPFNTLQKFVFCRLRRRSAD